MRLRVDLDDLNTTDTHSFVSIQHPTPIYEDTPPNGTQTMNSIASDATFNSACPGHGDTI